MVSGNFMENDDIGVDETVEDYNFYTRGYLYVNTMTALDIGTISTTSITYHQWGEDSTATPKFDDTFLQFSTGKTSVLVGREASMFDGFIGNTAIAPVIRNFSEAYPVQASLTASVAKGVTIGFSIEDSEVRGGPENKADFAAMAELKQSWGKFRVSGGLHRQFEHAHAMENRQFQRYLKHMMPDSFYKNVDPNEYGHEPNTYSLELWKPERDFGYGVNAMATFNVPVGVNPTELTFQATYMDGAISYLGGTGAFTGGHDSDLAWGKMTNAVADVAGFTGFALVGSVNHPVSDTVTFAFDVSYAELENESSFTSPGDYFYTTNMSADIQRVALDASLMWEPAAGLQLSVNAGYSSVDIAVAANMFDYNNNLYQESTIPSKTLEEAYLATRLQYTF